MSADVLTPVHGGHVFAGTWEGLADAATAKCAACGYPIKWDGEMAGGDVCSGWEPTAPRGQLARVARGLTREAPDDKPNGPTEASLVALHDAHHAVINQHDSQHMIVKVSDVKAEGDRIYALGEALADDCRALRLALEHDERAGGAP